LGDQYPETAIKLYHEYIEGFIVPPFWFTLALVSPFIVLGRSASISQDGDIAISKT